MKIKIDFIAPPYSGHLYPLIELAESLSKADYEIRFITGPQKIPLLHSLGFHAVPLLADHPEAIEKIANTAKPVQSNPIALFKQLKENLALLPTIKEELTQLILTNQTKLVVADFVAVPAGMVCAEYAIPWITVIPTPFVIETMAGTPSYLGGYSYSTSVVAKLRDFLGRKLVRSFKWLIGLICFSEFKQLKYQIYRADGTENAYSPQAILGLGMAELEFPRDWPSAFKLIGPCCNSPEKALQLTLPLENYDSAVLVTLGTHLEWAKQDLISELQWLTAEFSEVLFVVSLGRAAKQSNEVVFGQANLLVYEYLPYSDYLEKFQVVIHHGGAGIVYNCIKYQKPSLVIPHDYDQFDFAARVKYAGIGLVVKRLRSQATVVALRQLLQDQAEEYAANLKRFHQALTRYQPAQSLQQEIERLLQEKLSK